MRELKIHTFDEIDEEEVRWLWKPYIPLGKITVIQGDPGNGKTTLALAVAAIVSRREKMPTGDAPAFIGNIIYQSGEDNPQDTLKPRLVACGADCSKISFIEADGSLTPELLEDAIRETNSKYVVLDPLQAFLSDKQDISSAKNMRPFLKELGDVAKRTGTALVIIGHMNKGEKSKGIYRGLGSIDITAAARSVLLIGKKKNDPSTRFMTQIKNNLSPFGKAISFTIGDSGGVEFLGECDVHEDELLSNAAGKKTKYQTAKDMIVNMLKNGDRLSNEVYTTLQNAGITSGTIAVVKRDFIIKSVQKNGDWYWTLRGSRLETEDYEVPDDDEVPFVTLDDRPILRTIASPTVIEHSEPLCAEPSDLGLRSELFEMLPLPEAGITRKRGRKPKPAAGCEEPVPTKDTIYNDLVIFDWRGLRHEYA